jgi:cytochrome c-type biogenesis protein CcsB
MIPTYAGYILLAAGLTFGLFRPKSRFRMLGQALKKSAKIALPLLLFAIFFPEFSNAEDVNVQYVQAGLKKLDKVHSRHFGGLAMQDNGRIKPANTLAREWIRSESRLKRVRGLDANQLALWAFAFPAEAESSKVFQNNRSDKMFRLFPVENDPLSRWAGVGETQGRMESAGTAFAGPWAHQYRMSVQNNDWMKADSLLAVLEYFQADHSKNVYPGKFRLRAEMFYNNLDAFARLAPILFWVGLALLACALFRIVRPSLNWKPVCTLLVALLALGFLVQTCGLGLRWFVSGHAPWTNKYESMVFIAWSVLLAGILFGMKNRPALAGAGILSGIFLWVARMDWIDPKITTLPPVLRSIWLVIHVSVIISSYGFLGLGAVLALFDLLLTTAKTRKTARAIEQAVAFETLAIERFLLVGLTLLVIGNFLGAVWANESWGRYWGWDPKETWTLVTILIYAMVLHLRLLPKPGGKVLFNTVSLFAFGSVLMTYFGVNLYLSGMHSYAAGERPGFPVMAFVVAGVLAIVCGIAWVKEKNKHL